MADAHTKQIQHALNALAQGGQSSLPYLAEDGNFGSATRARIAEFQHLNNLNATGLVDDLTATWLQALSGVIVQNLDAPPIYGQSSTGSADASVSTGPGYQQYEPGFWDWIASAGSPVAAAVNPYVSPGTWTNAAGDLVTAAGHAVVPAATSLGLSWGLGSGLGLIIGGVLLFIILKK